MKERSIILRDWEVRAFLDGRKSTIWRPVKGVPTYLHLGRPIMDWGLSNVYQEGDGRFWLDVQTAVDDCSHNELKSPFGKPGDVLAVKEPWWAVELAGMGIGNPFLVFDDEIIGNEPIPRVERPLHSIKRYGRKAAGIMPLHYSRLTLEVVDVRVERVQGISEEDAKACGVPLHDRSVCVGSTHRAEFRVQWDKDFGKSHPWSSNPWAWVAGVRRK